MNFTDEDYDNLAPKIAAIFKLKRSKEYPDRWVLDMGWGTKTNKGLVESFLEIAKRVADKEKHNNLLN